MLRDMSEATCLALTRQWDSHRNPFSDTWKTLVREKRPLLVELACYENSILSSEVERRFGAGSSVRLSEWNGADLETAKGVALAKKMIGRLRPMHVWISCECGPFCPLQRLNRKTEEQRIKLDEKQSRARRQYSGAIEVANYAMKRNIQVHWELAQRSEAWALPEIVDFIERQKMQKVSCAGCCVGLRTLDKSKLMCKSWTIATRNKGLLQHLNLKCQKNHPRGKCEAGEAAHTSRYTEAFARKVVDSLVENEAWSLVVQELGRTTHGEILAAEDAEEDEECEAEVQEGERRRIEGLIQHIHKNTGHGSLKNLVEALRRRGARPEVLRIAKAWSCPTCTERKAPVPRRWATLDTLSPKFEVLELDAGTWIHPVNKEKFHFLLMVDAGSRFKIGRILSEHKVNNASWKDWRLRFEESWVAMFGRPRRVRTDPAGPLMSAEAQEYFASRDMILEPIPAEAHWQLSNAEQGIKTVKGIMEALAGEFSDMEHHEILARAVWACNMREVYRGYSPMQMVLGKAPDEHGRFFESAEERPLYPELMSDGGFKEDFRVRCAADKAFADEQARRRLERAARMGYRRAQYFVPGELVYYWRRQVQPKDRTSFRAGTFLGPARVLATESRIEQGEVRPGSIVWLHCGGRLMKTAPEQLRRASLHEQEIEELKGPVELPWTFTALATDPRRRTYTDLTTELPDDDEWEDAAAGPPQPAGSAMDVPRKRLYGKGPGGERGREDPEEARPAGEKATFG